MNARFCNLRLFACAAVFGMDRAPTVSGHSTAPDACSATEIAG